MPHRCVHCRITLPKDASRCPTCESNVAEEVPESDFTIEVRVTHNRDGSQLRYVDDVQGQEGMGDGWPSLSAERLHESIKDGGFHILEAQTEVVLAQVNEMLSGLAETKRPVEEAEAEADEEDEPREYQEPPYEVEFLKVGQAREWSADVKAQIRAHRDQIRTIDESEFTEQREIVVRTITKDGWMQAKVDEAKHLRDNPDAFDFSPYEN